MRRCRGLVSDEQRSAATALYSMNFSVGMTAGPALTALFLLVGPPTLVLAANALTFVLSAAVLGSLRIDRGTPVHARAGVGGRAWVALDLDRRGRSVGESPPRVAVLLPGCSACATPWATSPTSSPS